MIDEFGTTTVLLSGVRSSVEKIWIDSTAPDTPATSTKSPDLNGRKATINTPAAKLDREP